MSFPPNRVLKYCPRCGSIGFIPQSTGRSFRCEACHFHYFINSSAAVACLILNEKKQLMLARRAIEPNAGMLDLPGGFIDPGESAEEAVRREMMEELQVEVTRMKYMASFPNTYPFSGIDIYTVDMAFICEIESTDRVIPGDDISAVEFVSPEQINIDELGFDSMKKIISYYISNHY